MAADGRVLCGEDRHDGTAAVLRDTRGLLGAAGAVTPLERLRGKRAVVADDDQKMRELLVTVLEKAGCTARACVDGAEAMAAIESAEPVDLVVSDIMMPHHDGYEIFSAARERDAHLPVLLITGFGYDPSHSLVRCEQEGLHAILYKPFTPQQLLKQLGQAMDDVSTSSNGALERTDKQVGIASLLAPVQPANIICIGRNFAGPDGSPPDGADELEVFLKPTTAIQADGQPIRLPPTVDEADPGVACEGELAVVIGKSAQRVDEADAMEHVLGYTIANDVTARRWQTATGSPVWMRGKGFDTFCPLGPALVTADAIDDPGHLTVTTSVNGTVVRKGSTSSMLRSVPQIISELSGRLTLEPGTVVLTGAPSRLDEGGPEPSLVPGDEVTVEIESIGRLVNPVAGH